jgi:ABC-type transporter lipoprotein component MlaA
MKLRNLFDLPILAAALLGAVLASGCAGWPTQEMSNARQAIAAAERAGAEQYAPEALAEARKLLASAKANSNKGDYRAARDEYNQAREMAIEARRVAEQAKAPKQAPDPTPGASSSPNPGP